jgi:hypothetical protein
LVTPGLQIVGVRIVFDKTDYFVAGIDHVAAHHRRCPAAVGVAFYFGGLIS